MSNLTLYVRLDNDHEDSYPSYWACYYCGKPVSDQKSPCVWCRRVWNYGDDRSVASPTAQVDETDGSLVVLMDYKDRVVGVYPKVSWKSWRMVTE